MAWWIAQNVVITTALAAVVLGVCRVGRLGPVARHALWVLVLVKFVTPPIVAWPWPVPDPLGLSSLGVESPESKPSAAPVVSKDRASTAALDHADEESTQRLEGAIARGRESRSWNSRAGAAEWVWLAAIWVVGSLSLLLIEGLRAMQLRRSIAHAAPADPGIVARVAALSEGMGVGPVRVLALPGTGSPFVYGAGQPLLVWPAEMVTESPAPPTRSCIDGLLVHELAHIKRRDHLVGWVELAASVVWWWNPMFWFVRAARREQAELACDAWVIAALPDGRRAYAESLLALSTLPAKRAPSLAVGAGARSRRVLERRLVMIMKGRAALHLPARGILTLALLSAATLPTWAAGAQTPAPSTWSIAMTGTPPRISVQPTSLPPSATEPRMVVRDASLVLPTATIKAKQIVLDASTTAPQYDVTVTFEPSQTAPPPPAPPPPPVRVVTARKPGVVWKLKGALPAEGQQLLETFDRDLDEIQREVERKMDARREALVNELQALQDKYTKAGQLDEALAIRNYLRSGEPGKYLIKGPALLKRR